MSQEQWESGMPESVCLGGETLDRAHGGWKELVGELPTETGLGGTQEVWGSGAPDSWHETGMGVGGLGEGVDKLPGWSRGSLEGPRCYGIRKWGTLECLWGARTAVGCTGRSWG